MRCSITQPEAVAILELAQIEHAALQPALWSWSSGCALLGLPLHTTCLKR